MRKIEGICAVDGCGRPLKARGYCNTHYAQVKRSGAVTTVVINTRALKGTKPEHCTVVGCDKPVKGKGLCAMHWARKLRHGYVKRPDRTKPFEECTYPGCTDYRICSGYCNRHYLKIRKYMEDHSLTLDQVLRLLSTMPDRCHLCDGLQTTRNGRSNREHDFYLDHNHDTGALRGWLCNNCNRGLGYFRSDKNENLLRKAIEYLNRPPLKIPD